MADKKTLKEWAAWAMEVGQLMGGLPTIMSLLEKSKPAAETFINHMMPETAIRLKRAAQKDARGAADGVEFLKTLLILDGDNPKLQRRPLKRIILSYLRWLNAKDPALAVIFVWIVGLEMHDDERFRFLYDLAHISDKNGRRIGDEAHEARFADTQALEEFRKPMSFVTQFMKRHPEVSKKLKEIYDDEATHGKSARRAERKFRVSMGRIAQRYEAGHAIDYEYKGIYYWFKKLVSVPSRLVKPLVIIVVIVLALVIIGNFVSAA